MRSYGIKSLFICVVGAAVIAGCASPRHSPQAQASAQGQVQSGKIVAIEIPGAVDPSMASSSGGGASGTVASSTPAVITVLFEDGTQSMYGMEQQPAAQFGVGDPVQIITDGSGITIVSP
jgi:ribosomal protein L21E